MSNPQRVGINTNVKQFNTSIESNYWKYIKKENTLEPNILSANLHITGNLTVDGSIYNPSDVHVKENIQIIHGEEKNLSNLNPIKYTYDYDENKINHFGLSAQEVEKYYPNLVNEISMGSDTTLKTINYIELIPLLICKIHALEKEIADLKKEKNTLKKTNISELYDNDAIYRFINEVKISISDIKTILRKKLKVAIM
jgi:hypothetical protein